MMIARNIKTAGVLVGLGLLAFLAWFLLQTGEPERLIDNAALFSDDDAAWIDRFHGKLLEEYDIDYRVATVADSGDLALYANEQFDRLDVGSASQSGRGLLLVIDAVQDRVRLEVAGALEPVYTDQFVSYIQTRQMVPFLAAGRLADGVLATSELIFQRAREATAGVEFMPPTQGFSAGGGAQRDALIGAGKDKLPQYDSRSTPVPKGELSPQQVVELYHRSMRNRDADFMKTIYTGASQAMMQDRVITPAQMDNAVKAYENCGTGDLYRLEHYAVIRYPIEERTCFPYFLRLEDGAWKLDLATMSDRIRFNHNSMWHFVTDKHRPAYSYAFGDSYFDKNGYPHRMSRTMRESFRWQLSYHTLPSGRVYVTWVGEGSPAEAAGFQYGDEIIAFAGYAPPSQAIITAALAEVPEGEMLRAIVDRAGVRVEINAPAPPGKR